jgi:hypothetical protein
MSLLVVLDDGVVEEVCGDGEFMYFFMRIIFEKKLNLLIRDVG